MAAAVEIRERKRITETTARSGFKGYGPGRRKRSGNADVKEDEILGRFEEIWKAHLSSGVENCGACFIPDKYHTAVGHDVKELSYSAEDVERFCIELERFQDEILFGTKAGLFLSALINHGDDELYTINVEHLGRIDNLGFRNRKRLIVRGRGTNIGDQMEDGQIEIYGNDFAMVGHRMKGGKIIIHGNGGFSVGFNMEGGEIEVNGNARDKVGDGMEGGTIWISGNAGDEVGVEMKGGNIVIDGNVDSAGTMMEEGTIRVLGDCGHVGCWMVGGEIHIGGEFERISEVKGGKIYHKGKLIFDK